MDDGWMIVGIVCDTLDNAGMNGYFHPQSLYYNYHAVQDSRNICPVGWHVPTLSEWDVLLSAYGDNTLNSDNYLNAAPALKTVTTQPLFNGDNVTNHSHLTLLNVGSLSINSNGTWFPGWAKYWTGTGSPNGGNYHIYLDSTDDIKIQSESSGSQFIKIRCKKD